MIPALTVTTTIVDDSIQMLDLLPARQQLLWVRRGEGMIGFGTAAKYEFRGATRFTDASRLWSDIVARASVHDDLQLPGTGIIAFGTFAFADNSAASSVLHVPSLILGRRKGRSWITRIREEHDADLALPHARNPAAMPPVIFTESLDPQESAPTPDSPPAAATSLSVASAPSTHAHASYFDAVNSAIAGIRNAELSKVVLARELVGNASGEIDSAAALAALAREYPDCWTFAVDDFLGSSPETLVAVTGKTVTARVLAGSAARGRDAATDERAAAALATSEKEQDEHRYAVHSVLEALRPHSSDATASASPFTLELPNLWHLATDVAGTLDDGSTSLDLAAALHPTAAVAGTPTDLAVDLIDALEPFDRQRYAGPVGWIGANGDGEWAIALRCAQISDNGTIRAWAGGGIVADSNPEHEFAETSLKFRPILEAFGA